ncbi:MAG TPA: ABC-F type ribosomal protection protein [Chloroflexia bacterium]|nr:ABC-F type ribosomal protection protein [Chloroflexia bacterium]
MLRVTNLTKSYGDVTVLDKINFTLSPGDKFGLIGPNGAGKSTLFRIIAGIEQADSGAVWLDPAARLGYLSQALVYAPQATVGQVVSEAIGPALNLLSDIERLAQRIASTEGADYNAAMEAYAAALEEAERLDAYGAQARLAEVLAGLGLAQLDEQTEVATLSGGQKTRLGLARLLLSRPDLLLLDEPTNHLDISALEWLEEFVRSYEGAALIVSHDRAFLDALVTRILALDDVTHTLKEYDGNYTDYAEEMARQWQKQMDAYRLQQEKIARIEENIRDMKQRAANKELETINFALLKKAKRGARTAKVRERKLEKLLNSEERIDKPKQTWHMKMDFGEAPPSGQVVLTVEDVSKSFGDLQLFSGVKVELRQGERIALLGPNGSGKTTLLRIISGDLAADSGRVRLGANVRPGYFSQEQEGLDPKQTALEAVRAVAPLSETEARNFMHFFLFSGDEVFTPVGQLSYGERARLVLARLVLSKVNLLLLDEPLNHLDITSRQQFEEALENFDGTILTVVHDRYFVEQYAERIWAIIDKRLETFLDLEDYEKVARSKPEKVAVNR